MSDAVRARCATARSGKGVRRTRDADTFCDIAWWVGFGLVGHQRPRGGFDVGVHDLQATILHLMGLDAHKLSYAYQGLEQRLIGPEGNAQVVRELLA